MPFLLFEQKSASSLEIPPLACKELITKIDRDFPPYVHNLPCIYDVVHRKCHSGVDECNEFLSKFIPVPEPPVATVEPPVVDTESPVVASEPPVVVTEEPKKKTTRVKKTKKPVAPEAVE